MLHCSKQAPNKCFELVCLGRVIQIVGESLAKELGVADNVTFCGVLPSGQGA